MKRYNLTDPTPENPRGLEEHPAGEFIDYHEAKRAFASLAFLFPDRAVQGEVTTPEEVKITAVEIVNDMIRTLDQFSGGTQREKFERVVKYTAERIERLKVQEPTPIPSLPEHANGQGIVVDDLEVSFLWPFLTNGSCEHWSIYTIPKGYNSKRFVLYLDHTHGSRERIIRILEAMEPD